MQSVNNARKLLNPITLAVAVFGLIVVVVLIFWIFDARKTARVDIAVTPKSAVIKLNGANLSNGSEHKIEPGEYQVEITHDEFKIYSETITLEEGETIKIFVRLELANDGDLAEWYAAHSGEDLYATRIGDYEHDRQIEKELEENPVLKYLPYSGTYYSLYTYNTEEGTVGINIKIHMHKPTRPGNIAAAEQYKAQALNKLRAFGLNPDDFTIIYSWN